MVNRANGHRANDHRANGNRADVVAPKKFKNEEGANANKGEKYRRYI